VTSESPPTHLTDPDGRTLLSYYAMTRGGRDFADLAEVGDSSLDAAAAAAITELSGWGLATTDETLAKALLERGATLRRHAHVHSRDLRADPAPSDWADPPLRVGLRLTPWDRSLEEIAAVALAAYPPGHPDFEPRAGVADVVERDLRPYAVDGGLGPLLPASGLVIEDDEDGGHVVAVLLVNDRDGEVPDGGPWVTEVARLTGTAYAGTGRALLQRAMAQLTADGQPALSLAVTYGNPARNLYEQLGIRHAYSALTVLLP
jgi:GNAT superfamily N-acetyltransferase